VLLAILLVVSMVFAACDSSATPESSAASSASEPASSAASSSAPETNTGGTTFTDGLSGVNELPFVESPVDFIIATPYYPYIIDYDTNEQTVYIEEQTGINIVWDILPEQGSDEKINLMFAAGTGLPDLFTSCNGTFTASMLATLGDQGLVAPLNDAIEKWKYNLADLMEQYPNYLPQQTAPDGNVYSLSGMGRNEPNTYAQRFWINQKFMDALGITKLPETTDEYYDYLVAVKNNDPNGNGKADEIPLAAAPVNNGWFEQIDGFLMQPFVYMDATNGNTAGGKRRIYLTDDGKVEYAPVQEGYREALKYLNKLYNEGLMSTEVFTMTKEELRSLVEFEDAEILGSLPSGGPHEFANTSGERRKDYVILPPLAGPDGTRQAYWNEYEGITIGAMVVPAASEKVDLAVKFIDYMLNEEMNMWGRYGVEGRDWQRPAEGVKAFDGGQAQIDESIGNLTWGEPQNVYLAGRIPRWGKFGSHAAIDNGDPYNLEKVLWEAHLEYIPYKTNKHVPPLYYTADEAREYNELVNTLHQYVELSLAEFVTGKRSVDTDWDAYVAECEKIGLPRIMEIHQAAFDRQWAETWKATH
jgi:putative aldouronate transport system substrate-binding protein